jgi:Bacterial extracellular solute-binding proteins, family 5 Middle
MEEKRSISFDLAKYLRGYWPIRWKEFLDVKTVKNAILVAPRIVRYGTVALTVLSLATLVLAFSTLYLDTTKIVGASGGIFREAVVGGDMSWFNPLIDRTDPNLGRENNIPEKKVNAFLYLPLYTVSFPNFLVNNKDDPTIKPILLAEAPKWQDSNSPDLAQRYKRLEMKLRNDLKWSNNTPITLGDIQYSFERLKEPKGNPEFREIFQNVTFEKTDEYSFVLVSAESNPTMLYKSNFSPVSQSYFDSKNTEGISFDKRSARPEVTSGAYTMPSTVDNPETARKEDISNPITKGDQFVTVILKNSNNDNYRKIFGESANLEYVMIKRFDRVAEGSSDQLILSEAAAEKSIDLYERSYESDFSLQPSRVSELLRLRQKQVPTNTFLTMFYNIKRGPTGYLINQSLRKYITCNLLQYTNPSAQKYLIEINKDRRILPIQFGDFTTIDCGADYAKLLDSNYDLISDPVSKQKQVVIKGGQKIELEVIGFQENNAVLSDLRQYFESTIGIPLTVITAEKDVEQRLIDKNYNIALLAHSVTSRDISENYSAKKRDLSSIPGNDRVTQYKFNENLDQYTTSNATDKNAKAQLTDFFTREIVSLNLYQYQSEYNYSPTLKNFEETLPVLSSGNTQIELSVGKWYINTKRVAK